MPPIGSPRTWEGAFEPEPVRVEQTPTLVTFEFEALWQYRLGVCGSTKEAVDATGTTLADIDENAVTAAERVDRDAGTVAGASISGLQLFGSSCRHVSLPMCPGEAGKNGG